MPVTDQQARAIVYLTKQARDQLHGARNWDEPGIAAAIAKVTHLHLVDVTNAAMRAADDRDLATPGAIGNPAAPCWRERNVDRVVHAAPIPPAELCDVCGKPLHPTIDHPFESIAAANHRRATEPGKPPIREVCTEETA